jgi:hypothetical protein
MLIPVMPIACLCAIFVIGKSSVGIEGLGIVMSVSMICVWDVPRTDLLLSIFYYGYFDLWYTCIFPHFNEETHTDNKYPSSFFKRIGNLLLMVHNPMVSPTRLRILRISQAGRSTLSILILRPGSISPDGLDRQTHHWHRFVIVVVYLEPVVGQVLAAGKGGGMEPAHLILIFFLSFCWEHDCLAVLAVDCHDLLTA